MWYFVDNSVTEQYWIIIFLDINQEIHVACKREVVQLSSLTDTVTQSLWLVINVINSCITAGQHTPYHFEKMMETNVYLEQLLLSEQHESVIVSVYHHFIQSGCYSISSVYFICFPRGKVKELSFKIIIMSKYKLFPRC